jgi:hypothetical protein
MAAYKRQNLVWVREGGPSQILTFESKPKRKEQLRGLIVQAGNVTGLDQLADIFWLYRMICRCNDKLVSFGNRRAKKAAYKVPRGRI